MAFQKVIVLDLFGFFVIVFKLLKVFEFIMIYYF